MISPTTAGEWDDDTRTWTPYQPPDWWTGMQVASHLGASFCDLHGIRFGCIVQAWSLTAQWAENGAQAYFHKKAADDARRRR